MSFSLRFTSLYRLKVLVNSWRFSLVLQGVVAHPACMMCQNYEKQLQRLQKEFLGLKDKKDALITFAKKEKVLLDKTGFPRDQNDNNI